MEGKIVRILLKSGFGSFDRNYVDRIVKAYQKQSEYFDIDANNKISLTSRGKIIARL